MTVLVWTSAALLAFLLGAVPWAYLVAVLTAGVDIRRHGSGNVGTANVVRVVGWPAGLLVLILDVLKGVVAVGMARVLDLGPGGEALCGLLAAVGHSWTPFLGFKGGKAVATSLGAFLAMDASGALVALGVAGAVLAVSRYFSAASLSGTLVGLAWMLIGTVLGRVPLAYAGFAIAVCGLIFLRHIPNLRRIAAGTEPKVRWPGHQSS